MFQDDEATRAICAPRSVLLVGASPELASRCRDAVRRAQFLVLLECDLTTLTNMACERKPLALMFPDHVYAFDTAEFDALARDIQGSVVTLAPTLSDEALDTCLEEALQRAELLRQPEPASRYVVVSAGQRRPRRRDE